MIQTVPDIPYESLFAQRPFVKDHHGAQDAVKYLIDYAKSTESIREASSEHHIRLSEHYYGEIEYFGNVGEFVRKACSALATAIVTGEQQLATINDIREFMYHEVGLCKLETKITGVDKNGSCDAGISTIGCRDIKIGEFSPHSREDCRDFYHMLCLDAEAGVQDFHQHLVQLKKIEARKALSRPTQA